MRETFKILGIILSVIAPILACGGSSSVNLSLGSAEPVNFSISGLPQYIAPSATPIPTQTQLPTQVFPTVYVPPSGYATYTPMPGCIWNPLFTLCATLTPVPGGGYINPGQIIIPATATPRPTYTPYPSATACSQLRYYFDDEVFTDSSNTNLSLGIAIGNIRTVPSTTRPDQQIAIFEVDLRNIGDIFYVLLAPFQLYVAEIDGALGAWYSSEEAGRDIGQTLDPALQDAFVINPGERVQFDMYAYIPAGEVTAIAYILDPYANGFDGTIAGGNVAYWYQADSSACGRGGRISGTFTAPINTTVQASATPTATVNSCAVISWLDCLTTVPGGTTP
ncbi:MAG: hypothetical protein WBC91_10325 [Phototrophicaceae bacterium]